MDYKISKNCIGCGMCENVCPEIFEVNDERFAEADDDETEISEIIDDAAEYAQQICPFHAIEDI